jgi:hypothetical protein
MKVFQARNLKIALAVLFCVSTPLALTTRSTVVTSNLERIQSAAAASAQSDAKQPFGVNGTNRTGAISSLLMLAPTPERSAIFPIFGLVAAVAITQLLRRRRIAQIRSISSLGQ